MVGVRVGSNKPMRNSNVIYFFFIVSLPRGIKMVNLFDKDFFTIFEQK